jgi:hypothetical protein
MRLSHELYNLIMDTQPLTNVCTINNDYYN